MPVNRNPCFQFDQCALAGYAAGMMMEEEPSEEHMDSTQPTIPPNRSDFSDIPTEPMDSNNPPNPNQWLLAKDAIPKIEGYRVIGKLGAGGMGVVWKAIQESTKREVALKCIRTDQFKSDQILARFQREVELAAMLEHPNIARVYDSGSVADLHYYALEYLDGKHLDDFVSDKHLSEHQILELFLRVCAGVESAHQRGVIHRDLKPENILVTTDGEPRILDFGLAKSIMEDSDQYTLTQDGYAAGTPAYMAPEQAAGSVKDMDTRTDVYAMGVMLYRFVIGDFPFEMSGGIMAIIRRILEEDARRPSELKPEIDSDLEAIILKALAKVPAERYRSAGALGEDLENYLAGEPIRAQPATASYFFRKKIVKHRRAVATSITLLLGVLGSVVFYIYKINEERTSTREQRNLAEKHLERAVNNERIANERAAAALAARQEAQAAKILAENRVKEAARSDWIVAIDLLEKGRQHEALAYLARSCEYDPASTLAAETSVIAMNDWRFPAPIQNYPHDRGVTHLAYSPDGSKFMTASKDGKVLIWDSERGTKSVLVAHYVAFLPERYAGIRRALFSPDGSLLLILSNNGSVHEYDVETGGVVSSFAGQNQREKGPSSAAAYSSDGKRILLVQNNHVIEYESRTGEQLKKLWYWPTFDLTKRSRLTDIAYSPDNKRVLLASVTGYVFELAYDTKEILAEVKRDSSGTTATDGELDEINKVRYSPDGTRFLSAGFDGVIGEWESGTGRPLAMMSGDGDPVLSARYSPDGLQIASTSMDQSLRIWESGTGRLLSTIRDHADRVIDAIYSKNGRYLASASWDSTARILDRITGEAYVLIGHTARLTDIAFSPQANRAVTSSEDGSVWEWRFEKDKPGFTSVMHGSATSVAAYSPDGQIILTGGAEGVIRIWDAENGRLLSSVNAHDLPVRMIVFSPDGSQFLSVANDPKQPKEGRIAHVWETRTGENLVSLEGHRSGVSCIDYDSTGTRIASGSFDGTVKIWDNATGEPMVSMRMGRGSINSLSFSPDGTLLSASATDDILEISATGEPGMAYDRRTPFLKLDTRKLRWASKTRPAIIAATYSPDGLRVAAISPYGGFTEWDRASRTPIEMATTKGMIYRPLVYSPDSKRILTVSKGMVYEWESGHGTLLAELAGHGHDAEILSARYSACGHRIATATSDETVRYWESGTGRLIASINQHDAPVISALFNKEGTKLLTADAGGVVHVWDLASPSESIPRAWSKLLKGISRHGINAEGRLDLLPDREIEQLLAESRTAFGGKAGRYEELARAFLAAESPIKDSTENESAMEK